MARRRLTTLTLAAATAGALALAAVPAGALDDTKPAPTCAGTALTDGKGDQADMLGTAPANLDVTSLFFKYEPDTNGLTANIGIADLNQSIPPHATGVNWYVVYTARDGVLFVSAEIDSASGLTFQYGTFDDTTGYTSVGDTTGKFFEGADGVIQIAIPSGAGGGEGSVLRTPYVNSTEALSIPVVGSGLVFTADEAPNAGGAGRSYTVATCGAETPAALPVSLQTKSVKASAAKKGKTLKLKLRASEAVTKLSAKLTKGKTSYGTGKLSKLSRTGTLRIKLKRAMRKGSYQLAVTGSTASGRSTVRLKLAVK